MEEKELQEIARQLRKPEGEMGKKIGIMMNEGNLFMNKSAIEALSLTPGDHILEIGPGNGLFVKDILSVDDSIRYTGVDFSELMIEEAKEINSEWLEKKRAEFVLANVEKLPCKDHSFTKIFTINTLYFWNEPKIVLKEIKRVLKPGGKFLLVFRPEESLSQLPFTKFGFKMYKSSEASELLSQNDFKIIDTLEINDAPRIDDEDWGTDEFTGLITILIAE